MLAQAGVQWKLQYTLVFTVRPAEIFTPCVQGGYVLPGGVFPGVWILYLPGLSADR
jgi:hypothetical protein